MKKSLFTVCFFYILFTHEVFAQKSVVVIPLGSEKVAQGSAAFAQGGSNNDLGSDDIIVSLPMTFSTSGKVIVNANGHMDVFSEEFVSVRCSINQNRTAVDFTNELSMALTFGERDFSSLGGFSLPFAGTRGFTVNPGSATFRLACTLMDGENVQIRRSNITAMFFPDQ